MRVFRLGVTRPYRRVSGATADFLRRHAATNTPTESHVAFVVHAAKERGPQRRQPSPNSNRIGSCLTTFRGCTVFTLYCGLSARGTPYADFADTRRVDNVATIKRIAGQSVGCLNQETWRIARFHTRTHVIGRRATWSLDGAAFDRRLNDGKVPLAANSRSLAHWPPILPGLPIFALGRFTCMDEIFDRYVWTHGGSPLGGGQRPPV